MMNRHKFFPKFVVAFHMPRIRYNTFGDGANFLTGRRVIMPHAFRAKSGVDYIDFVTDGNGVVRAFRQAHIAVCAFVCNE